MDTFHLNTLSYISVEGLDCIRVASPEPGDSPLANVENVEVINWLLHDILFPSHPLHSLLAFLTIQYGII